MFNARHFPVFALVAALAVPLQASAQTPPPAPDAAASAAPSASHHHRRHESFMRALRSLDLTPAQKQQIATFRAQQKQANANADAPTRQANAAKMHDQIMGILTPDQQTQLKTAMHRPAGHMAAAPLPSPAPQ